MTPFCAIAKAAITKIIELMPKNKESSKIIAIKISIMLATHIDIINGNDFTAKITINKIISQLHTCTFSARINNISATNKSNPPSILTSINL